MTIKEEVRSDMHTEIPVHLVYLFVYTSQICTNLNLSRGILKYMEF